ncbi:MAG: RnfABCDGE type electron transport complex subunit A [Candidatus Marinimicrobia bacterium]|nr:RnfABCDGE type electron transport complex subunit A [Candidatus Neomarinimicrobiota bacterium]
MEYIVLAINAILVQNILLAQYLGNCPFMGVSKKMETATGMGLAVLFVMTFATCITWFFQHYFLIPMHIEYLQTIVFIVVIAALVQLVEMFLKKLIPPLFRSLGIFLPLITTNCAILGVAVLCIRKDLGFMDSLFFAVFSGIGFLLAIVVFAGLRERFEISFIPKALQDTSIALVTAGLMALAFYGFVGIDGSLKALTMN